MKYLQVFHYLLYGLFFLLKIKFEMFHAGVMCQEVAFVEEEDEDCSNFKG